MSGSRSTRTRLTSYSTSVERRWLMILFLNTSKHLYFVCVRKDGIHRERTKYQIIHLTQHSCFQSTHNIVIQGMHLVSPHFSQGTSVIIVAVPMGGAHASSLPQLKLRESPVEASPSTGRWERMLHYPLWRARQDGHADETMWWCLSLYIVLTSLCFA